MSYDFNELVPQIQEIKQHVASYPNAVIKETTNKRIIIGCVDGAVAVCLKRDLIDAGYTCDMEPGLKTSTYYVQAHYNYPY